MTTFVALAVIVILAGAALPPSSEASRFLGVLAILAALAWVGLTGWWARRLRGPRHRPQRALRTLEIPGPRWIRIGLAVLCVPVALGAMAILAHHGVSAPMLIGAIVGPTLGVLIHHRRLRSRFVRGGDQ